MMRKDNYEKTGMNLTAQDKLVVDYLTERGILLDLDIDDPQKRKRERVQTKKLYHNTMLLLENYRDIMWAMECIPDELGSVLNSRLGNLDTIIEKIDIQMSMENMRLESRLKSIVKSRLLLEQLNESIEFLKRKPGEGEMLYNVIYATYIASKAESIFEVIDSLGLTKRRYYSFRNRAISLISMRLWSAPDSNIGLWVDILTLLEDK